MCCAVELVCPFSGRFKNSAHRSDGTMWCPVMRIDEMTNHGQLFVGEEKRCGRENGCGVSGVTFDSHDSTWALLRSNHGGRGGAGNKKSAMLAGVPVCRRASPSAFSKSVAWGLCGRAYMSQAYMSLTFSFDFGIVRQGVRGANVSIGDELRSGRCARPRSFGGSNVRQSWCVRAHNHIVS